MKKRIISFVLAFSMLLSNSSVAVFALQADTAAEPQKFLSLQESEDSTILEIVDESVEEQTQEKPQLQEEEPVTEPVNSTEEENTISEDSIVEAADDDAITLLSLVSGDYTYIVSEETATITEYSGTDTYLVVPASLNGYSVVGIGDYAFRYCSDLIEITLPETLQTIGYQAFYNCTALESISIPSSVTFIDSLAFSGCSALTSVTLPATLETIKNSTFYNCYSLNSITLPNALTKIESSAFKGCAALESIQIPASVTSIGRSAFDRLQSISFAEGMTTIPKDACYGASSLISVSLPSTATAIGSYAFSGCNTLTTITFPETLTAIESYAFHNCVKLSNITLPTALTDIGSYAFGYCSALQNLTIPAAVSTIGRNAFYNGVSSITFAEGMTAIPDEACYNAANITSVTIPSSVLSIGSYAFSGCTSLVSLTLPEGITTIKDYSFQNCSALTSVSLPDSLVEMGDRSFYNCSALQSIDLPNNLNVIESYSFYGCIALTHVTLPDNLSEIKNAAFYGCAQLNNVVLPGTLKTIGSMSFYDCSGVTNITIPASIIKIGNNAFFNSVANITFAPGTTNIPESACYNATNLAIVSIPASVVSIGDSAFYGCSLITEIVLPDSLSAIGRSVFYNCSSLKNITIPASVTAIGNHAFYNSAESIVFANGTTSIPESACYQANKLISVSIPESVATIGEYAFYGCESLQTVTMSSNLTSIENYSFYNCSNLASIILPPTLTSIGRNAFYNCSAMESIFIPANVSTIENNAFYNSVKNIVFAEGTISIPENACYNASNLTSVTIPSTVTSIGSYAFYDCGNLTSISLPTAVLRIENSVFERCSSLTNIALPSALLSIGSYSFYECSALTSIVLPNGLTSIGVQAFSYCTALESIEIPASVTTMGSEVFYDSVKTVVFADGITVIPANACYNANNLETVTIPSSVTVIGESAFYNCSNLKIINTASSFSVGENAFYGCKPNGTLSNGITWSIDLNNQILAISGNGPLVCEGAIPWSGFSGFINSIVFSDGITEICDNAFIGCRNLIGILLPDSVKTVGVNAFKDCINLKRFEAGTNLMFVGTDAFSGCTALDTVIFSGDAIELGDSGLTDISGVTVYYPQYAEGWDDEALTGLDNSKCETWDNSQISQDIVLVFDVSGSMEGNRIAALIEAATALVNSTCGKIYNTRYALVSYDSSATLVSGFSSDPYLLSSRIGKLTSGGGTHYLNAMSEAEAILSTSDADVKTMLFFSDGEPNDSTEYILSLAEKLRNRYYLFTLGLSPSTSGRNLLINMAGGKDNYFEAADIYELIEILGGIDEEIDPVVEKTQVKLVCNLNTYDLLTENYSFVSGSSTYASITVTPFWDGAEPGIIRITQNGETMLKSENGIFSNIQPGKLFSKSGTIYLELIDSNGSIVESKRLLLKTKVNLPAEIENADGVIDESVLEIENLLENIEIGPDSLRGPSITIYGKTFYLFEVEGKLKLDLGGQKWNIQANVDADKRTIQLLIGYKTFKKDTNVGNDYTKRGDWTKSYSQVRNLYNVFAKEKIDWNDKEARAKFSNLYNGLKDSQTTIFLNIKGSIAGFMEWSYATETPVFNEGGIIVSASGSGSIDARIPAFPLAYCTIGIEGTANGKITLAADSEYWVFGDPVSLNTELGFKPALNVGIGVGNKRAKTYLEGGLKGGLDIKALVLTGMFAEDVPSFEPLTVKLFGALYLKYKLLMFGGEYTHNFGDGKQILPQTNTLSLLNVEYDASMMSLIDRDYLNNSVALLSAEDFKYTKTSLYPYSDPQLIRFSDGSLLMIWLDDTGVKSDIDRTSLMYSLYDPQKDEWTAPATIHDNAGYNGTPVVAQSGDTVYIVWERIENSLPLDATVEEMYAQTDVYYTMFSNGVFSEPVFLSDTNTDLGVNIYTIAAEGENVAVAWVENSMDDILLSEGTNSLYLRKYQDGVWSTAEAICATENTINSVALELYDGDCYVAYEDSTDTDTVLNLWCDGRTEIIAESQYSTYQADFYNGTLYYLMDSSLYALDLISGEVSSTGHDYISNFDLVSNGDHLSVLTLQPTGFTCEMYASMLQNDGNWGDFVQVTDYGKYIRSYSAVLDDNGQIVSAFNLVDVDEDNLESPYGTATLAVKEGVAYADLIAGDAYHNEDDVAPGAELEVTVSLFNNNLASMSSVTCTVLDQNGSKLAVQEIACEIMPGATKEIIVTFKLPEDLSKSTLTIELIPDYAESNTDNNICEFVIGYADLVIEDTDISMIDGHMVFTGIVLNQGYDAAENVYVELRDGNNSGDVFASLNVGTLDVGESKEISCVLPDRYTEAQLDDSLYAVNAEVVSDSFEMDTSNNSQRHIFEGVHPVNIVFDEISGSVRVSVVLKNTTESELNSLLILAVYNKEGRMVGAFTEDSVTKVNEYDQVNFSFDDYLYSEDCTMKLFWLNSNNLTPVMTSLSVD